MTYEHFIQELESDHYGRCARIRAKSIDYNKFYETNMFYLLENTSIGAEAAMLYEAEKKMERIKNLISKEGKPKFESLQDNLTECADYLLMLSLYLREKEFNYENPF